MQKFWHFSLFAVACLIGFFLIGKPVIGEASVIEGHGTSASEAVITDRKGKVYSHTEVLPEDQHFFVKYNLSIDNKIKIRSGDQMFFYIPTNVQIAETETFPMSAWSGRSFGDTTITKGSHVGVIVFNDTFSNNMIMRRGFIRLDVLGAGDANGDLEAPGTEEPGTEEPGVEEPGTEEPGVEEPGTEEPGVEEPGTEEPGTEEPGVEEPGTEEPGTEHPGVEEPGTEEPGTETPGVEEPGTEHPGTETPGVEEPGTEHPSTEVPGIEVPGTEHPSTETPGTEEPGTETPSVDHPSAETPGVDVSGTETPSTTHPETTQPENSEYAHQPSNEAQSEYTGSGTGTMSGTNVNHSMATENAANAANTAKAAPATTAAAAQQPAQDSTQPVYAASAQSNTTAAGKHAATLPQTNENTNPAWVVLGLGLLVLMLAAGCLTLVYDKESRNN